MIGLRHSISVFNEQMTNFEKESDFLSNLNKTEWLLTRSSIKFDINNINTSLSNAGRDLVDQKVYELLSNQELMNYLIECSNIYVSPMLRCIESYVCFIASLKKYSNGNKSCFELYNSLINKTIVISPFIFSKSLN